MIIEYDDSFDTLWVMLRESHLPCVVVESQTPGILLRVELGSRDIISMEVIAYSRAIAAGPLFIPELPNVSVPVSSISR